MQLLREYYNFTFIKDREKYMLTRTLVEELVSVMKLKSNLPDLTLMMLVHLTLQVRKTLSTTLIR